MSLSAETVAIAGLEGSNDCPLCQSPTDLAEGRCRRNILCNNRLRLRVQSTKYDFPHLLHRGRVNLRYIVGPELNVPTIAWRLSQGVVGLHAENRRGKLTIFIEDFLANRSFQLRLCS